MLTKREREWLEDRRRVAYCRYCNVSRLCANPFASGYSCPLTGNMKDAAEFEGRVVVKLARQAMKYVCEKYPCRHGRPALGCMRDKTDVDAMTTPEHLPEPIFEHTFDLVDKLVMVQMPVPTIGDTVGWFPYVEKFRRENNCRVVAVLDKKFIPLFEKTYPEITLITKEQVPDYRPYACYYIGLFFRGDVDHQPCDFRFVGLHRTAGYILGVDPTEERTRFDLSAPRTIQEPYVCIAAQSSSQAKYWNNPHGWREVVAFLKEHGYRVLCIDKDHEHGTGIMFNHIPYGSEDYTGALPLQERINLLKDADFFIGVSSGLSWLAWGCGITVVMISGFTHPTNEFFTPYRVINYHVCNSCWNDVRVEFDHYDFLWCPRHKSDERQFECSRAISCKQVIDTIQKIPAFQARQEQA